MVGQKHVFWQALVFTIVVFGIGLIFGYFLESNRADKTEFGIMNSEISMADEQIRGKIVSESNINCSLAKENIFNFADKVYKEAMQLEKYSAASKFNGEILNVLHKRYDLLRTMLWQEGIALKNRCNDIHTIVYFFEYNTQDIDIKAKQTFYSGILIDLKNKYPSEILLIPIAGNLDLASVELTMKNYDISELPSILIDENKIIDDIVTFEQMEDFIFQENKSL